MYRNNSSLDLCETKVTSHCSATWARQQGRKAMSRDLEKIGCLTIHYRSASATVMCAS